ncbi:hypothetical protein [Candidatus Poriferisodalis sp.]|uniref:hypothetical protein n=1 Tax=Candidatus Poriferisodalis sp. TaxID=3101277 RepID=UPI003B0181A4
MSAAESRTDDAATAQARGLRSGRAAVILLAAIAGVVAVIAAGARGSIGEPAGAQTSVSPVLSCPGAMVLDSGGGQCRTPRTETVLRPSSCPAGWTRVGGEYGGHECQRRVEYSRDTGRTRQVYSHTTYDNAWISTGTRLEQTGTNRVWVRARTMLEPLVPPVRVQVGTRRQCDFDPVSGQSFNCRDIPVYEFQTTHAVTIPGYWDEQPIYGEVETGYWDRVPTIHYTTEPIYETVVEWQTTSPTVGSCAAGWQPVGSQCQRTVLGEPSAVPQQSCPAGSTPQYGDGFGGGGPSVLLCESSQPGTNLDNGIDQDDSGGSMTSPDGGARPLHHLAGESDERLAELGIHRCVDGLLSYVPCGELPGREWDSDPNVCDDIEGTEYRPDHGGSCVTANDLLDKCTMPGDCETTTIRTYCPAIGELVHAEIQEHVHPDRGAETYRVCVFECANFATLPSYVQLRINGSYDYACRPLPQVEPDPTLPTTTTTTATEPDTDDDDQNNDTDDDLRPEQDDGEPTDGGPDGGPDVGPDGGSDVGPDGDTGPSDPDPEPGDPASPPIGTSDPGCDVVPPEADARNFAGQIVWASFVRAAADGSSPQQHMPGGGRFLQVAPGRGWVEAHGSLEVLTADCRWVATRIRVTWSELRPWVPAERQQMSATTGTRHLVTRWDALDPDQQQLVRQWHQPGASPHVVECTTDEARLAGASTSCGWLFRNPAAFEWHAHLCFEQAPPAPPAGGSAGNQGGIDDCWVNVATGVDWIRSAGDYADGRLTVATSGPAR